MTTAEQRDQSSGATPQLPEGIAYEPVSRFLHEHAPEAGDLVGAELIGGGRSNLTYRLITTGKEQEYVLRRQPLGHILPSAHDMGREFKFIAALRDTEVPVPPAVALCEDASLIGGTFYIMGYRPGHIVAHDWPAVLGGEEGRSRASRVLIETLAKLHKVDWRAVGLGDLARPGNYIERQLKRLGQQWELSDPGDFPEIAEIRRRLSRAVPPEQPPTIVHGDYSFHNVLLSPDDPGRIAAVLDWELAAIGDSLADVSWMLAMWGNSEDTSRAKPQTAMAVTSLPGTWTREKMLAEYARASGRDVSQYEFYHVFALFKLLVIWAGIWGRFRAGVTRGEGFAEYGDRVKYGVQVLVSTADASSIPALRGE